jgi:hypothetical protein
MVGDEVIFEVLSKKDVTVIYIKFNWKRATKTCEENTAPIRVIGLFEFILKTSGVSFLVLRITRGSGYPSTDDVICEIKSLDNLKTFVETMIPDVPEKPWLITPDARFWRLVSLEMKEGEGLTIVENPDDTDHSLQELIAVLEEQKRIEILGWNIHSSALMLDKGLRALPDSSFTDNEFLKRVATANHMLSEHGIDHTEIGSGVSHASTAESASENVVGYRRETLSLEDLHAEYTELYKLFRAMTDNPPADEQAPE